MRHQSSLHLNLSFLLFSGAIIIALVVILLIPGRIVQADIAPPQQPPGANLSPEDELTQVRMMEETVIINVLPEKDLTNMGQAEVWAQFLMENLGSEIESLLVRFPISANDGAFHYPRIKNFRVTVDGQMIKTAPLQVPGENGDTIEWIHFEVQFPPGEIVDLMVEYTLNGTGEYPFVSYAYLLETGAGWKDTIGSGNIIVNLPYPATVQTVFVDSSPGWGWTSPDAVLKDNQVRWHFENLEPAPMDNISIALVWPSAWNHIELERQRVSSNPADGEAWGRLGKGYKDLARLRRSFRDDLGGEELFRLSLDAYENALELLPDDALWHAGLGDLLFWRFGNYFFQSTEENRAGYMRALEEFYLANSLDPEHPYIKDYIEGNYFSNDALAITDNGAVFLWLTQTPTLKPLEGPSQT
ncbi:MAG: hypothetical protein MUP11_13820, partial [Anaerolineales bacterium]|nr:hypothetical protein [Anaerolineales bacterium]